MELRNKKTGQVGNFVINRGHFECLDLEYVPEYSSLAELNEEWEDYEEPKDFWYIDGFAVMCGTEGEFTTPDLATFTKRDIERLKAIGNYFGTKEEAERAVEKLKAWKRLKDKGFRFTCYMRRSDLAQLPEVKALENLIDITAYLPKDKINEMEADLDLLCGGEE